MVDEGVLFKRLCDLNRRLRGPGGCMWDRSQSLESMKKCVSSEVDELLEAIDAKDSENIREELGDVLYNVVFIASIAEENGDFTISDVLKGQYEKMVERHPHVFDGVEAETLSEAKRVYMKSKKKKKK